MRKLTALLLLSTGLLLGQPSLLIPHIADGGGWKTSIVLFNSVSFDRARVSIIFRGRDGDKAAFSINNFGTVSSLDLEMTPGNSVYLETTGAQPDVQVGWVQVDQVAGTGPLRGFAVFRATTPGKPDFEAVSMGMRAAGSMTFPYDNTNGFVTSFAVANVSPAYCTIEVAPIYDESGKAVTDQPKIVAGLPSAGQTSFASTDRIPEVVNKRGYLTIRPLLGCGPAALAVVGLRFNPTGPFTNLAPLDVTPAQ